MTGNTTTAPQRQMWKARHFPFLMLVQFLAFAGAFYVMGRLLAAMDIPMVFAYFLWVLGICVALPVLAFQHTTLVADRCGNELTITWQTWWGGLRKTHSCHLDEIETIRLADMRKTYRGGADLLHGVTQHNWRLWAVLKDDEQVPLLPFGNGSGFFDRKLGEHLAEFLGVQFLKEVREMPK